MKFIVFDLEWSPIFRKGKVRGQEITEIGAVEVSVLDGMILIGRRFHCYVRSRRRVSRRNRKFTNMKDTERWLALRLPTVIRSFDSWVGKEPYIFCSWGEVDRRILLKNMQAYHLDFDMVEHRKYFDLQDAFSMEVNQGKGNLIGLGSAVKLLGLRFVGKPHRSVDDAYNNTARVFVEAYHTLEITPEPFIDYLEMDKTYKKKIWYVKLMREKVGVSYKELSEISGISEKELEQIESLEIRKTKKEIAVLTGTLLSMRGETAEKR
ncbi:exonuclease domain-containing protein [Lentibacillus sediminis]|uniref:exonuclease domain-containing protein n=1 Tax=Lentibacillus sediminis TaxID=1940529 RepID=UPI00130443AF|nr:3'-5' exonuclease [Lentibacillus sediminis]